ncbi:AbgT family transporter [Campylobacter jejuni]|uniref:AbgT family transporter n=1 Tax=Campylobacter jejuni TaxID=197 RepID=UPI000AE41D7B|nr:AbgT family transporter [Campylobacter jejuni]EHM2678619.1 AbgT family transporter [Campylobacter jejuni]EIA9979479.1 AbgT family transporter [Campylobacter jejuni]EID3794215.1 AbgT family transporter [Campylobacter jejuni]EIO2453108.1 AbgT family transporter [Campylobacter jejuni]EIS7941486.1 AbgT family transporter [Campylobacter jejuni]
MNIFLKNIEKIGNKIPDVSILFIFALIIILLASFSYLCLILIIFSSKLMEVVASK